MNAHPKLITILSLLLFIAGCRTYKMNIVMDQGKPAAHHIAAPHNELEWFDRVANSAFVVNFVDPSVCTGDNLDGKPGSFLVCPGGHTSCKLQKFNAEEAYDITVANAAQAGECPDHHHLGKVLVNVESDHCPGCIISTPPDTNTQTVQDNNQSPPQ